MRYYNVYLYSSCPVEQNPDSKPSYWVWKLENCQQNDVVPENANRMSLNELMQYKQNNKIQYNTWVGQRVAMETIVDKKVKKAISSVNSVVNKFCAENIVMGITQSGKTKLLADALKDVFYYAQTGSLYECLNALNELTITEDMAPFLTSERRTDLSNKLVNLLSNL